MDSAVSRTQIRSFVRPFFRERLNLVLVVLLPVIGISLYGQGVGSFPESLFADGVADPTTTGRLTGAVFAAAALPGILGLFQAISARETDIRLLLCGSSQRTLLVNRVITVLLISVVGGTATVGVLWLTVDVRSLPLAIGVFVLISLMYSLLGILVGSLLPRELEGSLALVFIADMDSFLTLDFLDVDLAIGKAFPLYYPHKLAQGAVLEGSIDSSQLPYALAYLLGIWVIATIAYRSATGTRGVSS